MSEVEKVVDRMGIMAKGRLVAEGTLAEILAKTESSTLDDAFVALVGAEAP
jgi:ABC-2 type transport system ATP-binding protein